MSTFSGKIEEIPEISVDRFDGENIDSEAFFLSHCHRDHMVGLSNYFVKKVLLQNDRFLYVSEVSSVILKKMHPLIRCNVKVLDVYKASVISLRNKTICVTPIPAGHCPGSVMFLFESKTVVLYTGDYRIHKDDIRKFKSFYDSMNKVKTIEKIYLDTTFFLKSYSTFPKREESLNELCKIIKEWTDKGKDYIIHLITSAKYGYEYVFNEIYKKIGMPVHVNDDVNELYSIIPEMDNSVTLDGSTTQIHSSCGITYQKICTYDKEVRPIKISAFRWTQDSLEDGLSSILSNVYYVCYSTHASYEEGVELIKFLRPKSIEPCVRHSDPYVNVEMMTLLEECLKELSEEEINDESPKLFSADWNCALKYSSESDSEQFDDMSGILDSPPKESVENLRRFLKQHSESFSLNKCEKVKLETVKSCEEFNFDQEFGVGESSSGMTVEKIQANESKSVNRGSAIIEEGIDKTCIRDLEDSNEPRTKEKGCETKGVLEELQSESDPFTSWILDSPPRRDLSIDEEESRSEKIESKIQDVFELGEVKQSNTELSESQSDLLKEIFFLSPSPSPIKELIKGNDIEGLEKNDERRDVASTSRIFNLSPENVGDDSEKSNTKVKKDSPPRKKLR